MYPLWKYFPLSNTVQVEEEVLVAAQLSDCDEEEEGMSNIFYFLYQ